MERISVTTSADGHGAAIVTVAGDIDLLTNERFAETLKDAVSGSQPVVIVDLSQVAFLGSAALSVLSTSAGEAADAGVALRLVANDRVVLRPLEIVGMNQSLQVFDSLEAALND